LKLLHKGKIIQKYLFTEKNISNENNTSRLFTSGRFLVTTTGIESLASTLPLQVITRANKAQNSCLLVGTSYIINQHGVYFT